MVLRWLPVVIWVGVILGLSSIPSLGPSQQPFAGSDKIAHAVEYGVLGFLFLRALGVPRSSLGRAAMLAVLFGLAIGTADEWYQRSVPGRVSDPLDAVADGVGATLGALLYVRLQRRRRRTFSSSRSR